MSNKKVTFKEDSLVHYYNNTSHEDLDQIIARVTTLVLKELKKQSKPQKPRKTPQKRKSPKRTTVKKQKKKTAKKKVPSVPKTGKSNNSLLLQEVDTPTS